MSLVKLIEVIKILSKMPFLCQGNHCLNITHLKRRLKKNTGKVLIGREREREKDVTGSLLFL